MAFNPRPTDDDAKFRAFIKSATKAEGDFTFVEEQDTQHPAESVKKETKTSKPYTDPFTAYRGKFKDSEDNENKSNDLFADAFDEEEEEESRMHKIARNIFPAGHAEIEKALEILEKIDVFALQSATIIEETLRGHLPSKKVDSMIAAALLCGDKNWLNLMQEFNEDTNINMIELADAITAPQHYHEISAMARQIFIANVTADLECFQKYFEQYAEARISLEELKIDGDYIARESRTNMKLKTPADAALLKRARKAFNALAETMDAPVRLTTKNDGTTIVTQRRTKGGPPSSFDF